MVCLSWTVRSVRRNCEPDRIENRLDKRSVSNLLAQFHLAASAYAVFMSSLGVNATNSDGGKTVSPTGCPAILSECVRATHLSEDTIGIGVAVGEEKASRYMSVPCDHCLFF